MKKSFWIQNYEDIRADPFGYESQKKILNEALSVLDGIFKEYDKFQIKYSLNDKSVNKAIWMLHLDALDTLRDCIALLKQNKHRIVGKLFRDITEILDLATLFWWEKDKGSEHLKKWYEDKIINHSEFRRCLKTMKGESGAIFENNSKNMYRALSKWTHHCYSALKDSYSLAGDKGEMLVYDGHSKVLILPQTISAYIWEIKDLILYFLNNVKMAELVNWSEIKIFLNKTIQGIKFL